LSAFKKKLWAFLYLKRLEEVLIRSGLPLVLRQRVQRDAFWKAMQGDKKSEAGQVFFVLNRGIGECDLPRSLDRARVESVLDNLKEDDENG
jgi:3-dehydroquinate synthetase